MTEPASRLLSSTLDSAAVGTGRGAWPSVGAATTVPLVLTVHPAVSTHATTAQHDLLTHGLFE
ncbi:hypothetical protein L2K20_22645 [Mycobacterium sp. MBM]|nr:hypothetical protein [Mycobacterium sp. MBM]